MSKEILKNKNTTGKVRILCYGDSNTWGYVPETGKRYPAESRYTGILQADLDKLFENRYLVTEDGLVSRTMISNSSIKAGRNGSEHLIPALDKNDPLDNLVLMIGTNELKKQNEKHPGEIGDILEECFIKTILGRMLLS